jgi:hypothetical protein
MRSLAGALLFLTMLLPDACAQPVRPPSPLAHVTPGPARNPPGAPIYVGNPATSVRIETRVLGISPDGYARWLAIAHFYDARGNPTLILENSNLQWIPSTGVAQWQNRMRYGQPSAIVSVDENGPIVLTVRATLPRLPTVVVRTDTRRWHVARVVAGAIGPHLVQVGWFPYSVLPVRVTRIGARGERVVLAELAGGSTYRDPTVEPGATYRYEVQRQGEATALTGVVHVPEPLPRTSIANISGTGTWLDFTNDPIDPEYYEHLEPGTIVRQAVAARLHYVELRVAYGEFFEIAGKAKARIDAIVDGLEAHGVGVIAWVVPRKVSFWDLRTAVEAAAYRTSAGRHFTGLAIDAERGDDFFGDGPAAISGLAEYLRLAREAVGPRYLIVAIVEDPFFEGLSNATYPYRAIASAASVLQPMAYWRMMRREPPKNPQQVESEMLDSYDELLRVAGRKIPISLGGQTSAITTTGYPPASEIRASMEAAKRAGAIGEAFFAWNDTLPQQWAAIGGFRWNEDATRVFQRYGTAAR